MNSFKQKQHFSLLLSLFNVFGIVFCVLIQFYFLCNFDLFIKLLLSPFKLFEPKFLPFYIVSTSALLTVASL